MQLQKFMQEKQEPYRFGSAQNVRAAYQMRISRPGIYILNPFRNTLTPGRVSYGNPDLKSAKNHIISLSYSNYGGKLSGEFKTNYLFSNNSITDIIFSNQDGVNTTYANIGRSQSVSFQLNLTWNIHRNFNVGIYANERYEHYHNIDLAREADRIVKIVDGKISETDKTEE